MVRLLLVAFCLWPAFEGPGRAAAHEPAPPALAAPGATATPDPSAPVPVPEPSEKAWSYYRSGNVLWAVRLVWGCAVPAVMLLTGWSARLRTWAGRWGRRWFFTLAVYVVLYTVLAFAAELPFEYYAGYLREHAYGLSNQTLGKWFGDQLKGLLVAALAGVALIWLPYLGIRRSPRFWWLAGGFVSVPIIVLVMLITPIWIDPLFNRFGPMKDKGLEQEILALAARASIANSRVFEVDKSVDTKAVNAYVTGFANTKRIVLWDTIIAKLDRPELLFVMGHEMGHYVLGHVWRGILAASALVFLTLFAVHRLSAAILRRFQARFGFTALADVASLPLLVLFFQVWGFLLNPAILAYSRHLERQADQFGLELTENNRAAALAFVKLQQENLEVPRPGWFYKFWRASHPALGDRIDFCNQYRPWLEGQPLRFQRHFTLGLSGRRALALPGSTAAPLGH